MSDLLSSFGEIAKTGFFNRIRLGLVLLGLIVLPWSWFIAEVGSFQFVSKALHTIAIDAAEDVRRDGSVVLLSLSSAGILIAAYLLSSPGLAYWLIRLFEGYNWGWFQPSIYLQVVNGQFALDLAKDNKFDDLENRFASFHRSVMNHPWLAQEPGTREAEEHLRSEADKLKGDLRGYVKEYFSDHVPQSSEPEERALIEMPVKATWGGRALEWALRWLFENEFQEFRAKAKQNSENLGKVIEVYGKQLQKLIDLAKEEAVTGSFEGNGNQVSGPSSEARKKNTEQEYSTLTGHLAYLYQKILELMPHRIAHDYALSHFPGVKHDLLPLPLGNVLRAHERRPNATHKMDGILLWDYIAHRLSEREVTQLSVTRQQLDANVLIMAAILFGALMSAVGLPIMVITYLFEHSSISLVQVLALAVAGLLQFLLLLRVRNCLHKKVIAAAIEYGKSFNCAIDNHVKEVIDDLGWAPQNEDEFRQFVSNKGARPVLPPVSRNKSTIPRSRPRTWVDCRSILRPRWRRKCFLRSSV